MSPFRLLRGGMGRYHARLTDCTAMNRLTILGLLLTGFLLVGVSSCSKPPGQAEYDRGLYELKRGNAVRAKALLENPSPAAPARRKMPWPTITSAWLPANSVSSSLPRKRLKTAVAWGPLWPNRCSTWACCPFPPAISCAP
jgi:hypothetical protein